MTKNGSKMRNEANKLNGKPLANGHKELIDIVSTTSGESQEPAVFLSFIPTKLLFLICVGGIYGWYSTYGYLQEELIAIERIDATIPLLSQYLIALFVAMSINTTKAIINGTSLEWFTKSEAIVGLLNNGSMMFSNHALKYVDYPTQALFKSSKILPVMAFGLFRKTYDYSMYKYVCAGVITLGLIVFNIAKLGSKVADMDVNPFGLLLLGWSLFTDGLVNTQTDIEKKKKKNPDVMQLMAASNFIGIIFSWVIILSHYVLYGTHMLAQLNMNNINKILIIGVVSTVGQLMIYTTIARFDCFILTVVNTSRKFFSICFSIFFFGHPTTWLHWVGIALVVGALVADVIFSELERKKNKKNLTKSYSAPFAAEKKQL